VASGHYARIGRDDAGRASLLRGVDHRKDQSYVLFGLPRQSLDRLLLPIGELDKPRVRAIAEELKLPVFNKPDSQEICFVPDQDYAGLVKRRTPEAVREGDIVDEAGRVIGRHEGHQHYTIGQRKGLGVAYKEPLYVIKIDPDMNAGFFHYL
jgi:tRNA-specific 2-thiouridylase